jgi:ATP-dependent DNA helicase RecG
VKIDPDTPIDELDWVPRNRLAALRRLGLGSPGSLLRNYPRRHEDRRAFAGFPVGGMENPVCLCGEVVATALKRFGRGRGVLEVTVASADGSAFSTPVVCRWFNMPYMHSQFMAGQIMVVYGRPRQKGLRVFIDHPEYEIIDEEEDDSLHLRRIVPVHPAGEGVTPRLLRVLVARALDECDLSKAALIHDSDGSFASALRAYHFPNSFEEVEAARRRLALDECFGMQVAISVRRAQWGACEGVPKDSEGLLVRRLLRDIPFALTQSQQNVMADIRRELVAPARMHRLLQGDVGSGKTIVALAALLHTIEAGFPAAIMAPTQILAEQHHSNFTRLLEPLGVPVVIRTGSRKTSSAPLLDTRPPVIVGTHALLHEDEEDFAPGLVVIDEQHKFGVLQRSRLVHLPSRPDVLVMTATPIPRTLAQTFYGDLNLSLLTEKPPGRTPVRTAVRPASKIPEAAKFLREHLAEGRQAYIVYALIDESDKLAAKAATTEFEKWRKWLEPFPVALLHGRTPPDEKDATMRAFRSGAVSALISTTVIEVGVDVPNASLLLVENAERFGLAQLHQLRGRVGRDTHKSFCILFHAADAGEDAIARLAVLERTEDGFEVAEEDLRLRGPGNVLGTAQTGLPPLKIASLARDGEILAEAARLADATLRSDPTLQNPDHASLHALVSQTLESASSASG